jgi:predicted DNA-binding transcriptional regulator YafY
MEELEIKLDISRRSIFRYFNLLEEIGYQIDIGQDKRYFIVQEFEEEGTNFSVEEAQVIQQVLSSLDEKNPLKTSLIKKLKISEDIHYFADNIVEANQSKKVSICTEALKLKCRLTLHNYHSINSNSVSERVVEPIGFDENYESIRAIDIRQPEIVKTFKINRAEYIYLMPDAPQKYTEGKVISEKDVFNFSGTKKISVQMMLNHKTAILLKEQYRKIENSLTRRSKNSFDLKVKVHSLEPLKRFVLANLDGVKIIRPASLKKEVKKFYEQNIQNL